eukprot:SAG31_NODE_801_length_12013_cov_23.812070_7_plen_194_part_00
MVSKLLLVSKLSPAPYPKASPQVLSAMMHARSWPKAAGPKRLVAQAGGGKQSFAPAPRSSAVGARRRLLKRLEQHGGSLASVAAAASCGACVGHRAQCDAAGAAGGALPPEALLCAGPALVVAAAAVSQIFVPRGSTSGGAGNASSSGQVAPPQSTSTVAESAATPAVHEASGTAAARIDAEEEADQPSESQR